MLKSLYISNFIIIDEIHIDLFDGMSALTGDTGAGKSIIVEAISQLAGNRASSQFVRKGYDKAVIEGIFNVSDSFINLARKYHIEIEDEMIITKEIYSNGKSNIKVNYHNVSQTTLKMIMPSLLDIHSQFETQSLFVVNKHIDILDQYIGDKINNLISNYKEEFNIYKGYKDELDDITNEKLSDEQLDFLQSQLDEINQCQYTEEEIDNFENELNRLKNYEKTNELLQQFFNIMSNNTLSSLDECTNILSKIEDNSINDYYNKLDSYYFEIRDIYEQIVNEYDNLHFDEYRFNELQEILFKVNRLKRKYGYSMEEIEKTKHSIEKDIDKILNREKYILDLKNKIEYQLNNCNKLANKIHNTRKENAIYFEKEILKEFKELYLDQALFKIEIKKGDLNNKGFDYVTLTIATNKGQDFSPLNETASGGEISRIMLAIKSIMFKYSNVDTILFDEVDTGVSGKIAKGIGEKMKELSTNKQVICITHLPQVASSAKYQYLIEKNTENETNVSLIRLLNNDERIKEIARMLSGDSISEEAINNAMKLLNE